VIVDIKICCAPNFPPISKKSNFKKVNNIVAHHRLTMSTVRLETFRDIATGPAHICRNLPEALVGLVGDEAFSTFCDRLDSWLKILDMEHKRETKQGTCFLVTIWLVCFFTTSFAIAFSPSLWMSSVLWVSPIPFLLVMYCSYGRPYGALSIDEILYKIRGECADMTRKAPNLHFLVESGTRGHVNHIDVSFSSLALLEIVRDKATLPVRCMRRDLPFEIPAHMCRDLPAALEGLVADETFHAFCDRLDSWLELLGAADYREAKGNHYYIWFIVSSSILFALTIGCFFTDNISGLLWMGSVFCKLTIEFWWICCFMGRPYGALKSDEIKIKIHAECDNMTHHAPNLSFKVVMSDPNGSFDYVKYVDYIGVSASLSTQESDVASVPEVIVRGADDTTIKIDNDENEGETDTEAETMSSTSPGDAATELV
jgi:hypothetical protein